MSKKRWEGRAFILGGLLSACAFLCIFGYRVLIPTYDDWLLCSRDGVDNMQHYQGWVAYRNSGWRFPIGLTEGLLYPDHISVIYTDSIPLFAFIFKVLSPILPETFQYFGIFGLICAFLLGGFASAFIYRFTEKCAYSVICALFFGTAFVFLHRMFYHTALSAQWIVVACLYLWLAIPPGRTYPFKRAAAWSLMSVMALLTEAYFLPMVWGIMVCDIIQYGYEKKDIREFLICALKTMGSAAAVTLVVAYCFGLFYGDVDSGGEGLGAYTFNLINFINPFWMSSVIPWLPSDFFQYEGLAYLGLGILVLIPVILVLGIRDKKPGSGFIKDHPSMVVFFLGFSVAAISPVVSLGSFKIRIPLPDLFIRLWSTFRSCGRLIWPVYYLILLGVCIALGRYVKKEKAALAILMAALALQLYDAHGFIGTLHERFYGVSVYESSLSDERWEQIAENYDHIKICPDAGDIYYTYEGEELEHFALENGLTMNIVYTARVVSDKVNESMEAELSAIRSGQRKPSDKSVYVFLDGKIDDTLPLNYYRLDGFCIGIKGKLH